MVNSWTPATSDQKRKVAFEMAALADEYEAGSDFIAAGLHGPTHGATILSILALEIRLKCAVLIEAGTRPHGHDLRKLWCLLSQPTREVVLDVAEERHPNLDDTGEHRLAYGDVGLILDGLKHAFEKGRYSYELNDMRSPDEMRRLGADWLLRGGHPEEADFAYYPTQRDGLNVGLASWIDTALGAES